MKTYWKGAITKNLHFPQALTLSATPSLLRDNCLSLHRQGQGYQAKPLSNPHPCANNADACIRPHFLPSSLRERWVLPLVRACPVAWVLNLVHSYLHERLFFWWLFFFKIVPGQKWPFAQEQTQEWFFKRIFDFRVRGLSLLQFSLCMVPRGNFCPVSWPMPAVLLSSCLFSSYKQSELCSLSCLPPCIDSGKFRANSGRTLHSNMYALILHTEFATDFIFSYLSSFFLFSLFLIRTFLILNCYIIWKYKLYCKFYLQ